MRLIRNKKTGEAHAVPDTVLANGKLLEIVRSFSIGEINKEDKYAGMKVIYECPDGSFRQQSGELITDKRQLKGMAKDHHYERALKWLEEQNAVSKTDVEEIN